MTRNNEKKDLDVLEFARDISMLLDPTPLADEFKGVYGQKKRVWYLSEREHLTVWALHYPTGGVEGFRHSPSRSFRKLYFSFGRPESLLWLAESLGEEKDVLRTVINVIKECSYACTQCKIIRDYIPVERIIQLIEAKQPLKTEENRYVMAVCRQKAIPSLQIDAPTGFYGGVALLADGTQIAIETETELENILESWSRQYWPYSSSGYPICSFAYVADGYKDAFMARRRWGKTYMSILQEMAVYIGTVKYRMGEE